MGRMVDLIRDGEAPASVMRRAAQGGLSLPAREAIEILVALAEHRELGAEAEETLGRMGRGVADRSCLGCTDSAGGAAATVEAPWATARSGGGTV